MFSPIKENGIGVVQPPSKSALPLADCIAKTYFSINGVKCAGRTVFSHCHIVGEVALALMARMPNWLREKLFPRGAELIAATHDTGKISPTFQEKIYRATLSYMPNSLPELEGINPDLEKNWGGHAGVSLATVKAMQVGKFIPEILGQHHGYSPQLNGRIASDRIFGGQPWQERREELITKLKATFNCDWPIVENALQARVLSGLTTVADWIGSSSWFEDPGVSSWQPLVEQALNGAGFIPPKIKPGLTFAEIFFGFSPHDAQQKLIENAVRPGVYIMEAPMGLGKTEAALYAAYSALTSGMATGIYFALPTQLTSERVHKRVNDFLLKILADDCPHRHALLLHGLAWLKQTEMGEDGAPGGSWFQRGKRGILAPFAVGTIDQALMAVMNVKHGFVRAFGLIGKVVILDEVHSYDAYTGTILDRLIEDLQGLQCTVIILSATLTKERRNALLRHMPKKQDYPLISSLPLNNALKEIASIPPCNKKVTIHFCRESFKAIDEVLLRAAAGQQVLWIENTVDEAQASYKVLAARAAEQNIACGLLHSRFLQLDRACHEEQWVKLYGKENAARRCKQGRILVGTQLLEQSLDIDADFLVTRMCPIDMLLQRLGRLWRHENTLRPESARHECWILAPILSEALKNPDKAFGKTALVYSPYVLCRSLEVLDQLESIVLPGQIRSLIDATYSERDETDVMSKHQSVLIKKRQKLEQLALVGLSQGGKTLPEHKASTRYSEQDTVDVFLFSSYRYENKSGVYVTLLNGEEIYLPRNGKAQERQLWRDKTATLIQNIVRVADYLAPTAVSIENIAWLKDYLYLGNPEEKESILRVAKIHSSGELLSINGESSSVDYFLNYDAELGYQAKKQLKTTRI